MENPVPDNTPRGGQQIRDFTDLLTWKAARILRTSVYRMCARFPKQETFALSSQMRRAAVSVTANLAEGYGRFSYQENIQFCRQSRGSVYELRDHLTTALDAGYITADDYKKYELQAVSVLRLVNGYIRATKQRKTTADRNSKIER
jgi:four helix bundle protein